jgi:hypothetical protein
MKVKRLHGRKLVCALALAGMIASGCTEPGTGGSPRTRLPTEAPLPAPFSYTAREIFQNGSTLRLELDSSYNIRPGKVEAKVVGPFSDDRVSTAILEWQAIPAQPGHAADQQK